MQLTANNVGQAGSFQHQRALVQAGHGQVFNHAIRAHIAEHADLALDIAANAAIGTQHDDVGGDAHALQFLAGMLGGLGFIFVRAGNIGHQNHMDVAAVFHALLNANLADGLQERLALNITGGTADFGDDNIGFGAFGKIVDIALDFVGNVGNDLHRLAQISALAFLVQHVPIDLARRQVRVLVQIFINKALIMTQIQVGFGSVISHEHLAVL